ncbi:putative membrane protein [Finegoldia magna SY403409CC001050417]|uniref:ABC transporter permease n=1 Tax=Finegoldia magna TaxID=1260 RepID=A0A7D4FLK7_FINMA|nr:hypothetical protein [Finegoldia magna]EGS33178.1 putative membrane protein [Finegoldia magna SY403409CC001050417]QKH79265.1 hypothetical protein FOC70_02340 [Finegoldia magna]
MKKIIRLLTFLLIFAVGLGFFSYKNSRLMEFFIREFDTTVNITTKPQNTEKNILEIQKIAKKNKISFIKEVYKPKNSLKEKQKINIFVYLDDAKWFKKSFKNIDIDETYNGINRFKNVTEHSILTSKEVDFIEYSKIENHTFNGDYHIKGTPSNIGKFIDELNGRKELEIDATIDKSFSVASEITQKQAILYAMLILIIVFALAFSVVIYNSSLSKEISIISLLGHDKMSFCYKKTMNLLAIPVLLSWLGMFSVLFYLINPDSMIGFLISTKQILLLLVLIGSSLLLFYFLMLYFRVKNVSTISWLKGYKKRYKRSPAIFKVISFSVVLYLFVVTVFGLSDYVTSTSYFDAWEKSKNYANVACAWPWTYVENDDKFEKIVVPKLNNLWDELDSKGAILFFTPNIKYENDDEYLNNQAFRGRYAYINKNYLELNNLVDEKGKPLAKYTSNSNEWIIFVPENISITNNDRQNIRKSHIFNCLNQKDDVSEKYIKIKKKQYVFTFDCQQNIISPDIFNYVLVMVNGKELAPTREIKIPSLVNGKFHPYIPNPNKGYDYLKPAIQKTQSSDYILFVTSVYDEVVEKIEMYKTETTIYFLGFLLSVLILFVTIKIDEESYFYNYGQKIHVSRLLGYDFKSIHKTKILQIIVGFIISIITCFMIILFTIYFRSFGFFEPRDGWSLRKLLICLIMSIISVIICFMYEIINIKKNEKNLVTKLKEGN